MKLYHPTTKIKQAFWCKEVLSACKSFVWKNVWPSMSATLICEDVSFNIGTRAVLIERFSLPFAANKYLIPRPYLCSMWEILEDSAIWKGNFLSYCRLLSAVIQNFTVHITCRPYKVLHCSCCVLTVQCMYIVHIDLIITVSFLASLHRLLYCINIFTSMSTVFTMPLLDEKMKTITGVFLRNNPQTIF